MRLLAAFCVAAALSVAQPTASEIPVVTVCDVLGDLARYNSKSIVLVGAAWGTDEGSWMVATCGKSS